MSVRVELHGPTLGDLTIIPATTDMRSLIDGPADEAEDFAQALEQIAAQLRRMHPRPIERTHDHG